MAVGALGQGNGSMSCRKKDDLRRPKIPIRRFALLTSGTREARIFLMLGKALPIAKVVRIAKRGFTIYGCILPNTYYTKYREIPIRTPVAFGQTTRYTKSRRKKSPWGCTVVVVVAPLGCLHQSRPITIVEDKV